MKKLLLLSIFAVTIAASMGVVLNARSHQPAARPQGPTEQQTIFAVGRIEGFSTEIELQPELQGRIQEVLAREGRVVEEGQVLLRLDDRQYRQEVVLAEADLAVAQAKLQRLLNGAHRQQRAEVAALCQAKIAELERAQLEWKRTQNLVEARAISLTEAERQRTLVLTLTKEVEAAKARWELVNAPAREDEVQMDRANIQVAEARLELAKVQLQRTELRAPRRGQVLKAEIEAGEMAGPASSAPAIILADTNRFQVRAFVEELDAPRVQLGMLASITVEGMPDAAIHGRVTRLSPRMTHKELSSDRPNERFDTKMREVWIELDGATPLVVGLRVDVLIDLQGPPAIQKNS